MNRKSVLVSSGSAFIVACAVTLAAAKVETTGAVRPPAQAGSGARKKAEEQFKNIQVLKGVPADAIFPTMQFVTASLGVECEFCHVENAFEKDDKKTKQTARKMMEMMFALNKDNFDGHREVTCYSCHRGNVKPAAVPVVMAEEPKGGMRESRGPENPAGAATSQNSGPGAEQLIDNYVTAAGGASAIDKVASRVMKGTIDFGGRSLPIDIYSKAPDERISFTHLQDGDSVTAFNGHEGWLGSPGRPMREMQGSDLDGAALDADIHLATHLKQLFSSLQVRGREKIGDHETYVVVGQRDGKPPIELYFDQQTGLLVRLVRYGETALGWLPTQIDYADYRDADGVKVPYQWTLARPSGRFTIQVTDLKQNVPVDDAKFVRPSPPQQPGGRAK